MFCTYTIVKNQVPFDILYLLAERSYKRGYQNNTILSRELEFCGVRMNYQPTDFSVSSTTSSTTSTISDTPTSLIPKLRPETSATVSFNMESLLQTATPSQKDERDRDQSATKSWEYYYRWASSSQSWVSRCVGVLSLVAESSGSYMSYSCSFAVTVDTSLSPKPMIFEQTCRIIMTQNSLATLYLHNFLNMLPQRFFAWLATPVETAVKQQLKDDAGWSKIWS